MAATFVLVTDALQLVAQLVPVIQNAVANNQTTIDQATWATAVQVRNADLTQLDTDIAADEAQGK
jgi:hypothetical protein